MPASRTLTVLFLTTTALLLAASSAGPAAAKSTAAAGWPSSSAAASPDRGSKWHGRRLEDEVAPEIGGLLALGAGQGHISYDALEKDSAACGDRCAAKGASYIRPCTYREHCRG